jgi:hypothetical protein
MWSSYLAPSPSSFWRITSHNSFWRITSQNSENYCLAELCQMEPRLEIAWFEDMFFLRMFPFYSVCFVNFRYLRLYVGDCKSLEHFCFNYLKNPIGIVFMLPSLSARDHSPHVPSSCERRLPHVCLSSHYQRKSLLTHSIDIDWVRIGSSVYQYQV